MRNGPYELVKAPENYPGMKYRGKYCYEHILVWWQEHNLMPEDGYEIHHINHNHRDNRIENLKLVTMLEHRKLHGELRTKAAFILEKCGQCKEQFSILKSKRKTRIGRNKYNKIFCSLKCGATHQANPIL
jgi:hypothetical protein